MNLHVGVSSLLYRGLREVGRGLDPIQGRRNGFRVCGR